MMILTALLVVAGIFIWLIIGKHTASSMNYTSLRRRWAYVFLGPIVPIIRNTVRWFPMQFVLLQMMKEDIVDMASKMFSWK